MLVRNDDMKHIFLSLENCLVCVFERVAFILIGWCGKLCKFVIDVNLGRCARNACKTISFRLDSNYNAIFERRVIRFRICNFFLRREDSIWLSLIDKQGLELNNCLHSAYDCITVAHRIDAINSLHFSYLLRLATSTMCFNLD